MRKLMNVQSYPIPQPQKPYWTVGKILGLFLGLLILGGIAVFAYSQYRSVAQSGGLPIVQVTVSGTAQTAGFATTPVRVAFAKLDHSTYSSSCSSDQYQYGTECYSTSLSAGVNNGQYSLVVDNHSTWDVFLVYNTALSIQSSCYAGRFTVNSLAGTYTFDVRC
jgi:hypothetical protein